MSLQTVKFYTTALPKNVIPVSYAQGHRGSAVIRILSAHKESYWNSEMCQHQMSNPFAFSDPDTDSSASLAQEDYDKVDTVAYMPDVRSIGETQFIREFGFIKQLSKKAEDRWLFVQTHLFDYAWPFPYVFVYNSDTKDVVERAEMEHKRDSGYKDKFQPISPSLISMHQSNQSACCIDVKFLLSIDYNVFSQSYFQMCEQLSLTPMVERCFEFVCLYTKRKNAIKHLYLK